MSDTGLNTTYFADPYAVSRTTPLARTDREASGSMRTDTLNARIRVIDYSENGDNRGQNLEEDAGTHRPQREPPEHPKVHERT